MIVAHIAGFSDAGKTTVCLRLAAEARRRGHVVGYIKHHHGPLDRPGSGTDRLREAGVGQRWLVGSDGSLHLGGTDDLDSLIGAAKAAGCNFLLVEGFKTQGGAKCWLRRHADDVPPKDVSDVRLDMEGAEALRLGAGELWRRMPLRDV